MESTAKIYISNSYQGNLNFHRHRISYTLVYHYLTFLFEHQPNDQMTDEELEQLAPWNEALKAEIQRRVDSQTNNE